MNNRAFFTTIKYNFSSYHDVCLSDVNLYCTVTKFQVSSTTTDEWQDYEQVFRLFGAMRFTRHESFWEIEEYYYIFSLLQEQKEKNKFGAFIQVRNFVGSMVR